MKLFNIHLSCFDINPAVFKVQLSGTDRFNLGTDKLYSCLKFFFNKILVVSLSVACQSFYFAFFHNGLPPKNILLYYCTTFFRIMQAFKYDKIVTYFHI